MAVDALAPCHASVIALRTMRAVMHVLARRAAALLGAAFFTLPAGAQEAVACTATTTGPGAAELACPFAGAAQPRVLRFDASFAGVHDDSLAAIGVRLDGQSVDCAAGGRARLEGDAEGDALSCAIAVPAGAQPRAVRLQLVWHHAEPSALRLRFE